MSPNSEFLIGLEFLYYIYFLGLGLGLGLGLVVMVVRMVQNLFRKPIIREINWETLQDL